MTLFYNMSSKMEEHQLSFVFHGLVILRNVHQVTECCARRSFGSHHLTVSRTRLFGENTKDLLHIKDGVSKLNDLRNSWWTLLYNGIISFVRVIQAYILSLRGAITADIPRVHTGSTSAGILSNSGKKYSVYPKLNFHKLQSMQRMVSGILGF